MATLAVENTIFALTSGAGVDEYTQSVHGPSPALKLLNATCSDAVIRMGSPACFTIMNWAVYIIAAFTEAADGMRSTHLPPALRLSQFVDRALHGI